MELKDISVKKLIAGAKDLNTILELNPPLPTATRTKRADIEKEYRDVIAAKLLREDDFGKLQKDTVEVLRAFDVTIPGEEETDDGGKGSGSGRTKPKKKTSAKKKTDSKPKEKKVGVIATILELITKKPMTEDQIVAQLVKSFPDRNEVSMRKTVKTQLPNRMAKEKNINIEQDDKGRFSVGTGKPKAKTKAKAKAGKK